MSSCFVSTYRLAGSAFVCAAILWMAPDGAKAGGYQLRQHGAGALGGAMAGASAGAHGLEGLFFNPAAAGLVAAPSASLGATLIAPDSEVSGARGNFGPVPNGGRSGLDDVMPDTAIPAFYAAAPLDLGDGERFAVGLALNAPFGLETDYGRTWAGRYHADTTRVVTFNVNPMLAYRATDTLTLGAGVQAQYYSGELSSAINFGQLLPPAFGGPVPPGPATDGHVIVEADDWGIGFNLGALWTPVPGTRIGVGYRSEVAHSLEGDANFQRDAAGIAAGAAPLFTDTGARAEVETPRQLTVGVSQDVGQRLTLLGEAQWVDWSTFDSLVVAFDNPNQPDDVTVTDWDDGWFVALGARYALTDRWRISAGAAYDWSPVPDATLEPRIPDADRAWLALGADWTPHPGGDAQVRLRAPVHAVAHDRPGRGRPRQRRARRPDGADRDGRRHRVAAGDRALLTGAGVGRPGCRDGDRTGAG